MPIPLDDRTRIVVAPLLTEVVKTAHVIFGRYVNLREEPVSRLFDRMRDVITKKKLKAPWFTRRALSEFLTDRLEIALRATTQADVTDGPLAANQRFADTAAVSQDLETELFTLPWRYRLMLPTAFGKPLGEHCNSKQIVLDEAHRVETFDVAASETIPLLPADAYDAQFRHRAYPSTIALDTVYFVAEIDGYIPQDEVSSHVDEFVHAWKGLHGLLAVDGSLVTTFRHELGPPTPALPILIHRISPSNAYELLPYKWLTLDDTDLLGRFATTDRLTGALEEAIEAIRPAFVDVATRSAARWHIDSLSTARGVLQIVQAAMALETLLGDEDEAETVGTTSLLANRLAYLVERSPSRRAEVLATFKRLYKIRSRIVHAGKASLADDERSALYDLRRFAHDAIHAQLVGLRNDMRGRSS